MSFTTFNPDDSVVSSEEIIAPMWSGNANTLASGSFFTSSVQESSSAGKFYLNVNQLPVATSGSEVQFAIAYGNASGSGSFPFNTSIPSATPSRDVYGQFRSLIYGDENSNFNFGGLNGLSDEIFVLSLNRSRFKESIDAGSLNLNLVYGSNTINLTDDSNNTSTTTYIGTNRYYNLVSGSNGNSYNSSSIQTASGSYGFLLPDVGLIILNPKALALNYANGGLGMATNTTASLAYPYNYNYNNSLLYASIVNGQSFTLKSQETISSRLFWVRVKNQEYNYTTNPSIIDDQGNIIYATLIDNPKTYITTVGLYNDNGELLAVAKLSKPLPKDFTKEALVRVKLTF